MTTRAEAGIVEAVLRLRSDEQLATLAGSGSDEAFGALHDRHQARLTAYAQRMLGNEIDVEDLVQDVFLEALGALRSSQPPPAIRAWLYGAAHERCVNRLRETGGGGAAAPVSRSIPSPKSSGVRRFDPCSPPCDC